MKKSLIALILLSALMVGYLQSKSVTNSAENNVTTSHSTQNQSPLTYSLMYNEGIQNEVKDLMKENIFQKIV